LREKIYGPNSFFANFEEKCAEDWSGKIIVFKSFLELNFETIKGTDQRDRLD
jgi:hypothetical protein